MMPCKFSGAFKSVLTASALTVLLCASPSSAQASHHYTPKQLEVLAQRVGKTYWVNNANSRATAFLTAPAANAPTFNPDPFESFEITELVGQKSKNPFYKIKLESGKEGFIRPEQFLEELNVTIVSIDPQADNKLRDAAAAEEEEKRVNWIQSQPWSAAVKQAAINKQAVPGMNVAEAKRVLGPPGRTYKVRGAKQRLGEEHWFYSNGDVLIFQNGLLQQVRKNEKPEPKQ
jgi:hypothetical protein